MVLLVRHFESAANSTFQELQKKIIIFLLLLTVSQTYYCDLGRGVTTSATALPFIQDAGKYVELSEPQPMEVTPPPIVYRGHATMT